MEDYERIGLNLRQISSRIGFALFFVLILSNAIGILAVWLFPKVYSYITTLGLYLIAIPLACIYLKKFDDGVALSDGRKMSGNEVWRMICLCFTAIIAGSLLGTYVIKFFQWLAGSPIDEVVGSYVSSRPTLWILLALVIIAPIMEELLFRRALISATLRFGKWNSIFMSALIFGLFHGNFEQFFYAFFIGLVFGYYYAETRKIVPTIIAHMCINLCGSILSLLLFENQNAFALASLVSIVLACIGLYYLIKFLIRSVREKSLDLPKGSSFANVGMLLFIAFCLLTFVLSVIPT